VWATGAASCADLEGIPSEERLVEDASTPPVADAQTAVRDGTLARADASIAPDDGDVGLDASVEGGVGPDCAAPFNADWAAWPMPNAAQDVDAGAPNPESYTDHGDGTVTDDVTGLTWQKSPLAGTFSWLDAQNACVAQTFAGYHWRLPSYVELVSLVDYGPSSPAVNETYFPSTPADTFWSATQFVDPTSASIYAYVVGFGDGATFYEYAANLHYARCVRIDPSP
jgi:hypothetical protein